MISPFTGGKVTKKHKLETFTFRKEKFTVKRYYFVCNDTGREFTNEEVDEQVFADICKQYRERHRIPSPETLKDLRSEYGFSAHIMSKIAGMGINQYGLYENGEMPTIAMGQKLALLFDKRTLLECIDKAEPKLGKNYSKVREAVETYVEQTSIPLAKKTYKDFFETLQTTLFSKEISTGKKARWSTYEPAYAMA
jgi:hypothetical protein